MEKWIQFQSFFFNLCAKFSVPPVDYINLINELTERVIALVFHEIVKFHEPHKCGASMWWDGMAIFLPNPTFNVQFWRLPSWKDRLFFAWTPPKRSALLEQPSLAEVDLAGVMMGSTLAWALCPHCKVCWLYLHHRELLCLHGHIKQVSCHISSQKIVKKATFWRTKKEKDELLIVSPILNGDEEGSTLQRKRRKEGKRQGADLLGDGGVLPAGALP